MPQLTLDIVPIPNKDSRKMARLRAVIQKKREVLQNLVVKTETLKVNLEMVKQEYMMKIGSLFLKDNHLDFEIIRLKNILLLISDGYTYDEAVNKIAHTYYAEQLEFEREQEEFRQEEEIFQKREKQHSGSIDDLKKIWKKLIVKFHPDLIQDPQEKKKREAIMKLVNRAYQEGDYDQLLKIEQENIADRELTIDNLEEILIRLINEIIQQNNTYAALKESEWYNWMRKITKAKKKTQNIFADTEKRLLNDIVAKLDIIKILKSQLQNHITNNV